MAKFLAILFAVVLYIGACHGQGGGGGGFPNWSGNGGWNNGRWVFPPALPSCTVPNVQIYADFINFFASSPFPPPPLVLGNLFKAVSCDAWISQVHKEFSWYVFLGPQSNYVNGPPVPQFPLPNIWGAPAIEAEFNSIGVPTSLGGSGFEVEFMDVMSVLLVENNAVLAFVNKTLVIMEGEARAGVTINNEWQSFLTFTIINEPPWVQIALYKETINTAAVLAWQGICQFFCVDYPG